MDWIQADNLTRAFGPRKVVNGITFSVGPGEIFGFLGPNGAGKTTTINMLTGQLQPTSGSARLLGMDAFLQHKQTKLLFGVVFEYPNLYERMSVRSNMTFSAEIYGVNKNRIDELLERVALYERANEPVKHLSNGMRQRLLIVRAIIHQPKVLFLDEPTRGLDPGVARDVRQLIAELAESGMSIFLTTHYMEEADQLCSQVAILNEGSIIALDTPVNLKMTHGMQIVKATFDNGKTKRFNRDNPIESRQLEQLKTERRDVKFSSEETTLEQVFLKLTGRSL